MIRTSRASFTIIMLGFLVALHTFYNSSSKDMMDRYIKGSRLDENMWNTNSSKLHQNKLSNELIDREFKEHDILSIKNRKEFNGGEVFDKPEDLNEILKQHNPSNINITNYDGVYPESHPCSLFGRKPVPSALSIWREHLSDVVRSSIHRLDRDHIWEGFTNSLLSHMTPGRLQKSVRTLPFHHWDNVGDILNVVFKRWNWINSGRPKQHTEPRKVNIIVMGGSVTLGVYCQQNPIQKAQRFSRRDCSWSSRLRQFIDAMTDKDLIEITNMAMGGSNTNSATNVWDYQLFPENIPMPDIVINAYSSNDMHVSSVQDAQMRNYTLEEMILQMNENFIRSVLSTKFAKKSDGTHCKTKAPLLLYFDDYIGNEQREILQTLSYSRVLNALSVYYGFGYISYADAVRDLVYSNTGENWFSPTGWPERQIHPGMGMHISSAWVFAFNFLKMATTYCEMPTVLDVVEENPYKPVYDEKIKDHPSQNPPALPPKLHHNLTLDNVSRLWQEAGSRNTLADKSEVVSQCDANEELFIARKCSFSWIGNTLDHPNTLKEKINNAVTESYGWKISDDHNKFGYLAEQNNAYFVMKFIDIDLPVMTINFFVMTSYGAAWEGSNIHVEAIIIPKDGDESKKDVTSMDISGYHDKMTSEIFPYKLTLTKKADIGNDLTLNVRLTGGSTFKITGMAMCSQ